jgi:hypothetical protein
MVFAPANNRVNPTDRPVTARAGKRSTARARPARGLHWPLARRGGAYENDLVTVHNYHGLSPWSIGNGSIGRLTHESNFKRVH